MVTTYDDKGRWRFAARPTMRSGTQRPPSRDQRPTSAASPPAARSLWRDTLRAALRRRLQRGKRILIVGSGPLADAIVDAVTSRPQLGHTIVGVVGGQRPCGGVWLERTVYQLRPHWIILAPAERRGWLPMRELLKYRVQGIRIDEAIVAYEQLTGKLAIEFLNPSIVLFGARFRDLQLHSASARLMSLAAGLLGTVVFAPLLGAIAIAIKLETAGPVCFVQQRVGLGGRRFNLFKFRTMHTGGDNGSLWVCDNEDRITPLGEWLRRYRFDELPQLLNLLRGDMNLVGPRPHPAANAFLFDTEIPYYWLRHLVRPGLTGWAQVRYGYANNLDEETEKVRYDLCYVKHRSLRLDLHILLATVGALFAGGGAARARAHPVDERPLTEEDALCDAQQRQAPLQPVNAAPPCEGKELRERDNPREEPGKSMTLTSPAHQ